ncbi:hypothetical protein [Nostoc sp. 'Lobaria pulmonaria (5183) cyanobiont']|uniref:hypothetical protein n=1 Tax=Nostoc sp. 'Lobaria pulmonaria (5183) cyanobiont' TaxID=1618022 RepID=UPI000CF3289D|nr:hypothetical protein [Nostoc sp. 'Lobaria pulmonaria (5183) cyanobiont']
MTANAAFWSVGGAKFSLKDRGILPRSIHIGYICAGWLGLIVSGVCFVLPAVLITGVGISLLAIAFPGHLQKNVET